MNITDVQETLEIALKKTRVDRVNVFLRPRVLSDNGSGSLPHDQENYLQRKHIKHTRGAP